MSCALLGNLLLLFSCNAVLFHISLSIFWLGKQIIKQIAGTEDGILEPQATFSACFGAAFIMLHPTKYAAMLAERMKNHGATGWLVNTGWTGGR